MQVEGNSLEELARNVDDKCSGGTIHGLTMHGVFPISELDSAFIRSFRPAARKWQARHCPRELFINHGEFIHRYGDGITYVHDELRRKPDSNRACLCLIDMKDLLGSQDDPIPSFIVLQFAFPPGQNNQVIVGAYFRALEVRSFLPINLAEICERIRELRQDFPNIETFELYVFAFRAYARDAFHCLTRTALDAASPAAIGIAVQNSEKDQIRRWINSKITVDESVICTDGLEALCESIQICKNKYDEDLVSHLTSALEAMRELKNARTHTSEAATINTIEKQIREHLTNANDSLK